MKIISVDVIGGISKEVRLWSCQVLDESPDAPRPTSSVTFLCNTVRVTVIYLMKKHVLVILLIVVY